jgi:hypothetical protein
LTENRKKPGAKCLLISLLQKKICFQKDYPGVLNGDNLSDILKAARAKKQ